MRLVVFTCTERTARNGDSANMATPVAALEDCSFLSMTAGGTPVVAHKASPERLHELDNVLSRALPRFRRIAMRWLGNHEDAEDAVQDAMLSAFKHIADFEGRAQMSTWLTAGVINPGRIQIPRRPRKPIPSLHPPPQREQTTPFFQTLLYPKTTP